MKRIITFLVLLFGVLSSLMAETNVTNNEESMTLYIPIECWRDNLGVAVFSSENDYYQDNPYKQVKASKVNSMYMGGRQVYKAVVPFISSPTIVSFYSGDNFTSSSSISYTYELTESGTWYYCYDVNSSISDRKGVWYRSFDEARFGAQMIDINLKPETNVLYFIEGELQDLSEKLLISPSYLNEILAGYNNLGCRFFPFSALNIPCHSFLAGRVCVDSHC